MIDLAQVSVTVILGAEDRWVTKEKQDTGRRWLECSERFQKTNWQTQSIRGAQAVVDAGDQQKVVCSRIGGNIW